MSASTTELSFEKWQGCLNDFLLISATAQTLITTMRLLIKNVRQLCAKDGSGIGADGIILVCPGEKYMVWVINKDGSFARNCGNGLRCAAMAYFRRNANHSLEIALGGRTVTCKLFSPSPQRMLVATDMGTAQVNSQLDWYEDFVRLVRQAAQDLDMPQLVENFAACEIANKHAIFFLSRPRYLAKIGAYLQRFGNHEGINVHLVWSSKGINSKLFNARSYERGVGETAACGTGACAIAAAVFSARENETQQPAAEKWLKIKMLGGLLLAKKTRANERMIAAGPAQYVFRGHIDL